MNFRLLLCIAMGVFVVHIGVFMLISEFQPKPKSVPPPQPNFTMKQAVVVDPQTGEKETYQEITVSTKFSLQPTPAPVETPVAPAVPAAPAAPVPEAAPHIP